LIFHRTAGIVLKRSDYSETSKIVTIYTRDQGKVRVLAKGAKRKKSGFLGILEPLSLLEVVYIEGKRGLHTLKEAYLLEPYLRLRERLSRIAHGLFFLSLIDRTQADEDPDPKVFELLSLSLAALESVSLPENVSVVFQVRLISQFGSLPTLSSCGACGCSLTQDAFYDAQSGSFLCQVCRKSDRWALQQGTLRALRRLAESPFERCGRVRLSKEQRVEIARVTGTILRTAVEAELPAETVLNSLLR